METIFMNSEKSKASDPHRLLLNLSDKINLKKVISMFLYQTLVLSILVKIQKKLFKNNKFKTSAPTWNEEFQLLDG